MINEYLHLFETDSARTEYEGNGYVEPYVPKVKFDNSVHYNQSVKAILYVAGNEVIKIYGSGELTSGETYDYKSNLQSVEIGKGCTLIGANAFSDCSILTSATIGNNVTVIAYSAFSECTQLSNVSIGNNVVSIGDYAFKRCEGMSMITIPNSVVSIGECAFMACSQLGEITFGSSLSSLGDAVFNNCYSLSQITCNANTAPSVNGGTFYGIPQSGTLYVPIGSGGYDTWLTYMGNGWTKVEQ